MAIELHCADFTADLIFEFDRNFSEIVDKSKQLIAGSSSWRCARSRTRTTRG